MGLNWISTKEEKPKEKEIVIFKLDDGSIYKGYREIDKFSLQESLTGISYWRDEERKMCFADNSVSCWLKEIDIEDRRILDVEVSQLKDIMQQLLKIEHDINMILGVKVRR